MARGRHLDGLLELAISALQRDAASKFWMDERNLSMVATAFQSAQRSIASSPKVSVLLPVFNGVKYVAEALRSILTQNFTDFELIVIDDGSTDGTSQLIASQFSDPRIVLVTQQNRGLAATLNYGLSLARAELIARQDHDDISFPDRLNHQVRYLVANPEIALIGTQALRRVEENGQVIKLKLPTDEQRIRFAFLFSNPVIHSAVMFRKSAILSLGGYTTDVTRQPPEDYELWSRLARSCRIENLDDYLVTCRVHSASVSSRSPYARTTVKISAENIALCLGCVEASPQMKNIAALLHCQDELVSQPNYSEMRAILTSAALKCSSNKDDARDLLKSSQVLSQLQRRLLAYRVPTLARGMRLIRSLRP